MYMMALKIFYVECSKNIKHYTSTIIMLVLTCDAILSIEYNGYKTKNIKPSPDASDNCLINHP